MAGVLKPMAEAKERELALIAEARAARERALGRAGGCQAVRGAWEALCR